MGVFTMTGVAVGVVGADWVLTASVLAVGSAMGRISSLKLVVKSTEGAAPTVTVGEFVAFFLVGLGVLAGSATGLGSGIGLVI